MTADEVKASLAKAARRCWPKVTKASDLPFPEYWKAVTEWLTFHAPHVGDALMLKLIDEFVVSAKEAEESGRKPAAPIVSDEVREIWANAGVRQTEHLRQAELANQDVARKDAWEHAAERAAEVRDFFAKRAEMRRKERTKEK